ncbi:hypothetical protein CH373_02790 [Leptospira perolatii]|uniref:Porin n=1 Tax=Leptospira perolatii TaxID=2023191 RepID=A0A2M9ZSG6_9LEPT|nr:hypothetical protein [Leptospira perolatii]PJZ71441.1 hypothetical protein CH360_02790 [Leptospira perolatii]PJZ74975.1 hypothetical protein CH373_02790 [Leptospira perolatii]
MKRIKAKGRKRTVLLVGILAFQTQILRGQEKSPEPTKQEEKAHRVQELYEDEATGQIYRKPGPNRKKIILENQNFTTSLPEAPLPNGIANRPQDPNTERLTITGRVQFRGISGQAGSVYANGRDDFSVVDWNFRRLRLGFIYEGDKWWGGMANLRLENAISSQFLRTKKDAAGNVKDVSLGNARGYIQEAAIWLNIPWMKSRLFFGAINVPFQREYIATSANLINVERSMATLVLPQFDAGVNLLLHPLKEINEKWERMLTVQLMVANGHGGPGDYGFGRRVDLAEDRPNVPKLTSPAYYGRMQWNVFGGLDKNGKDIGWIEGEEIFQKDTKLSLGAAFADHRNIKVPSPFNPDYYPAGVAQPGLLAYQTTPDGGDPGASYIQPANKTSPGKPKLGLIGHTYDFTFTSHGFYANGAYSVFSGSAAPDKLKGYHLSLGYVFHLGGGKFIMPTARYDYLQGDLNWNKSLDPGEVFRSYWIGLNLFGDKHVFKAQIFYQIFRDKLIPDRVTGQPTDVRDNVVYFQLQANFWTGTMTPERFARLE